jgi:hypothetical protein
MQREGAVKKSDAPNASFDEVARGTPPGEKPVVGDADAVQKTTWVVGKGTNPDDADLAAEKTRGRTPSGEATKPPPRGTDGLDR